MGQLNGLRRVLQWLNVRTGIESWRLQGMEARSYKNARPLDSVILNTGELANFQQFAILILNEKNGVIIRATHPPKQ